MRLKRRCAAILCTAGLWISSGALAAISPTTGRQIPEGRFLPVLVSVGNEYGAARAGGRRVKAAGMGDRALWGAQDADIFYESMHTCRSAGKGEAGTRWTLLFSDALARDGRVQCGPARSLREPSASLREEWQGALVYLSRMPQRYMGDACERLRADSRAALDLRDMNRLALGGRLKGVKAPGNYSVDVTAVRAQVEAASMARPFLFTDDASRYEGCEAAGAVALDWGGAPCASRFLWDAAAGEYRREVAGVPFACYPAPEDRQSGDEARMVPVGFANVIVQHVAYEVLGPLMTIPQLVGEGRADFFLAGRHVPGTWQRPSPQERTVYLDDRGRELALLPGRSYIAHLPPHAAVSWE